MNDSLLKWHIFIILYFIFIDCATHLVIPFTQELEFLRLLVHEHPVQVAGLHAPDLYGFVAPAHDLTGPDVGHAGGQFSPLEDDVLGHLEL